MYYIQHCFICRLSDSTVSEDAGIEPRTVATLALAIRRSNHSARSHLCDMDFKRIVANKITLHTNILKKLLLRPACFFYFYFVAFTWRRRRDTWAWCCWWGRQVAWQSLCPWRRWEWWRGTLPSASRWCRTARPARTPPPAHAYRSAAPQTWRHIVWDWGSSQIYFWSLQDCWNNVICFSLIFNIDRKCHLRHYLKNLIKILKTSRFYWGIFL